MKNTALVLSLSGMLLTTTVQADTLLGLYLGADGWRTSTSGGFADNKPVTSFNFEDETQTSFYVALEHPVPVLPNIRIQHNPLEASGVTTLSADVSIDGQTFAAGTELSNSVEMTSTDYVLYYEILDNDLLTLDLGVNAKNVKGHVAATNRADTSLTATHSASEWIPLVYANGIVGLPLTGLELFAQGSYMSLDGNKIYDVQAGVAYALLDNMAIDFKIKAGYRAVNLTLDDVDNLYADIDFKGAFAGIEIHF